jgi:hypothetical protein
VRFAIGQQAGPRLQGAVGDFLACHRTAAAFDTTLARLGVPTGPNPVPWSWSAMIEGVIEDGIPDPGGSIEIERNVIERGRMHSRRAAFGHAQ